MGRADSEKKRKKFAKKSFGREKSERTSAKALKNKLMLSILCFPRNDI